MKKIIAVLLLVVALFCIMLPISVAAQEEAPNTVIIDCNAIGSDAYKKTLRVYFKNVETGQIIDRRITTVGNNKFTDIPPGEYEFVKCTLDKSESVMYELAKEVENLVVYEDKPSVFHFKVAETATEAYEGAMDNYKLQQKAELIYALLSLAIIILLILWIIYAIKGRKVNRMKWVARLVRHLFLSTVFLLLALSITNLNSDQSFWWIVSAGLPYGIAAASFIFMSPRESMAYETPEQARSRGSVQVTLVFIVGALIGIIALPIIFISDIIKIIKNPEYY